MLALPPCTLVANKRERRYLFYGDLSFPSRSTFRRNPVSAIHLCLVLCNSTATVLTASNKGTTSAVAARLFRDQDATYVIRFRITNGRDAMAPAKPQMATPRARFLCRTLRNMSLCVFTPPRLRRISGHRHIMGICQTPVRRRRTCLVRLLRVLRSPQV